MKTVRLFYLSPNPFGGWVTYTANLYRAMKKAGLWPSLYKIRPRGERKSRKFGYGIQYRNVTLEEAMRLEGPSLIVAAAKKYADVTAALIGNGAYLVLHDPTELKNIPGLVQERTIVIRQAGLRIAPEATFIRHPYVPQIETRDEFETLLRSKTIHAVSTARIDHDKNTHVILAANKGLPDERQVQLHGFENRIYGRFKLMEMFPDWADVQSSHKFPREQGAAVNFLRPARWAVDLSEIKGDGGGTQYTFLEAWDAGAALIVNEAWTRDFPDDDLRPGVNCIAVPDANALREELRVDLRPIGDMVRAGRERLVDHDPEFIGGQYAKVLGY